MGLIYRTTYTVGPDDTYLLNNGYKEGDIINGADISMLFLAYEWGFTNNPMGVDLRLGFPWGNHTMAEPAYDDDIIIHNILYKKNVTLSTLENIPSRYVNGVVLHDIDCRDYDYFQSPQYFLIDFPITLTVPLMRKDHVMARFIIYRRHPFEFYQEYDASFEWVDDTTIQINQPSLPEWDQRGYDYVRLKVFKKPVSYEQGINTTLLARDLYTGYKVESPIGWDMTGLDPGTPPTPPKGQGASVISITGTAITKEDSYQWTYGLWPQENLRICLTFDEYAEAFKDFFTKNIQMECMVDEDYAFP